MEHIERIILMVRYTQWANKLDSFKAISFIYTFACIILAGGLAQW